MYKLRSYLYLSDPATTKWNINSPGAIEQAMNAELLRLSFFVVVIALCLPGSIATAQPAMPITTRPVTVKVAAVQCSSELGEVEANRRKLMALCEEAAGHG